MSPKRQSHRRDFLRGRAAVDAVHDLVDQLPVTPPTALDAPPIEGQRYLLRFTRRAMACDFEVLLNVGQYAQGGETALAALDLVDQLEDQLSSYRALSEISRLNRDAVARAVVVENRLWRLLERAVDISRQTDGAYDVTSGPLSRVWGFMRRAGAMPDADQLVAALAAVGSQHLRFDRDAQTIQFDLRDMEINLGSIGKGYALDRCAELFAASECGDYLLHGGHSSLLARGSQASALGAGWRVGIRDPLRPHRRLAELWLVDRAMSTSSAGLQHFVHEGRKYGHLIDPRTGWPAEGVLSATVLAPDAAEAEAFSTAFYVLGPVETARVCRQRPEIGAIVTVPGEQRGSLVMHRFNIADELWASDPRSGAVGS